MTSISQSVCEPLIDAVEAAELLHISKRALLRLALLKRVPGTKIGNVWRFRASKLDEWIKSRTQEADE